jgi:SNF2 family DNA or RNA helicase
VDTVLTYQPQHPRWAHQDKALRALEGAEAFALFMEMRTGKTKVILDEFGEDERAGTISNLLVIAPAGVYRTWETDIRKHLGEELLRRVRIDRWESGPTKADKTRLEAFLHLRGRPRILLINIEALSTVEAARKLCGAFLTSAPTTMVIDESTTIKNIGAKRTTFCVVAGKYAKKRRILSGLPTPQSPLDIYSQYAFLDPEILGCRKFTTFRNRYAVVERKPFGPGGRFIDVVTGYQNLDELKRLVHSRCFRVKLDECYGLPPKMYIRREVTMTKEQQRHYAEMHEYATTVLKNAERVTATMVLVQMLRLHQILAGYARTDDGTYVDIPENKTAELLSILEEHPGKAIIWAAYDRDVTKLTAALTKVYGRDSVARFWGGNADTREAEEKRFLTDPHCRFMISTASAGGRGRTWAVADIMIYYSNTFSLEHRMQSEERTQLVGKTESVGYFDLVAPGTVEDKILDALRNKMKLSDAITGDNYREWIA